MYINIINKKYKYAKILFLADILQYSVRSTHTGSRGEVPCGFSGQRPEQVLRAEP